MKRRSAQERDEADARERAEARTEALLAELKARQANVSPAADSPPAEEPSEAAPEPAPEAAADAGADEDDPSEPA